MAAMSVSLPDSLKDFIGNSMHPTQKAVSVLCPLIESSKLADVVADALRRLGQHVCGSGRMRMPLPQHRVGIAVLRTRAAAARPVRDVWLAGTVA